MTTINCAENCKFQKDGHCTYELITASCVSNNPMCIYFNKSEHY